VCVRGCRRRAGAVLAWLAAASPGCSDGTEVTPSPPGETPFVTPPDPAPDALDPLYSREQVLEVTVELAPQDWQALRAEGRALFEGFLGQESEFAFTEYVGSASVNGQRYDGVLVRKKGFLGSLSRPRPSLKLDFGEVEAGDGRVFERLTLNNNRQDYSRSRTCLAYDLFARAGLAAPRCNLAHVVVNGEDLGTYSNVEPVKKPLLRRYFGDVTGNLYEGQLVDFVAGDVPRFQLKTNESTADTSDLQALASALEAEDAELATRLGQVLDLDRYRDFWAMERLTGHWDGYAGNRNNFYLYHNPASGRFEFIPWGTDGAFAEAIPGDALNTSSTVYARGLLANRLYNLPEQRTRFRERLGELNEAVWQETALVAELTRLTSLVSDTLPDATAALRRHLQTHGGQVRAELDEPAPEWVNNTSEQSPCFGTIGDVSLEFATEYGDLADVAPGLGRFEVGLSLDGAAASGGAWFGRAGVDATATEPSVALRVLSLLEDGQLLFVQIAVPPEEFSPGSRALHGFESIGVVLVLDGADTRFVGFISDGTLELDAASAAPAAPVSGRLSARLLQTGCAAL
jgi:spore coat protein H